MDFAELKRTGLIGLGRPHARTEDTFPFGLGRVGVHEIVEAAFGDFAALTGFAAAACAKTMPKTILWIAEAGERRQHGHIQLDALYRFLGNKPGRLHLSPRRAGDVLWVVEEAIRSKAISLIVAEVSEANFTASRRLTLASNAHKQPVILLMPHTREGATAAEARWRVSAAPSAPNQYDTKALGNPRWRAVLERSRTAAAAVGQTFDLEYNNETLSLDLAPRLAARSVTPHTAYVQPAATAPHKQQTG